MEMTNTAGWGNGPSGLPISAIGLAASGSRKNLESSKIGYYLLFILFLAGWVTEGYSLVDVGRYSILLLYVAALPFCIRMSSRSIVFLALPILSAFFGILVALLEGFNRTSILSQSALQVLAIVFAAGVASIDWRRSFDTFAKAMVIVGVPVVAYGGYQMIARAAHLPFAYLPVTNQQAYADGGLQRGWEKAEYARASSFFVEPAGFGYFCLWLFVLGLSLERGRLRYAALALACSGILFSQSLSAVLGVGVLLLAYFFTHPISLRVVRQAAILVLVFGVAIMLVPPLMPEAFAHFSERIQQALALDERADSGRVDHLPACWEIFKDAPVWGHGLSSLASAEVNGNDVTTVTYALLLMERGVVGTSLFLAPWVYIGVRSCLRPAADSCRTPALLLSALNLYAFWTCSILYLLPFWLSLGITASLMLHTHATPNRRVALAGAW
jgi:hypothetical protein